MAQSPLRLRQYFFTKIHFEAVSNYKNPHPDAANQYEVKVQSTVGPRKDNDRDWRVILDLHVSSLEKSAPYQLDLQVTGFFEVLPDFPDDKVKELIRITGASILYSGAREFVLGITSRGPWGPVLLPAISFMKPDQPAEPKAKRTRKAKSTSSV